MMDAIVYYQVRPSVVTLLHGHQVNDRITPVVRFNGIKAEDAVDRIFAAMNGQWVVAGEEWFSYPPVECEGAAPFERRRSMSVGDVIVLTGPYHVALSCDPGGWRGINDLLNVV